MAQAWHASEYRAAERGARAETVAYDGLSFHGRSGYPVPPWQPYGGCWELPGEAWSPASGRPAQHLFHELQAISNGQADLDAGAVRLARLRFSERHLADRLLPVPERRLTVDPGPGCLPAEIDLTKPPPAFPELQYARSTQDCSPSVRVFHAVNEQEEMEQKLWTSSQDTAPMLLQGGSVSRELPCGIRRPQHFAPRYPLSRALRGQWPQRPPLAVQRGFWNRNVGTLEGNVSKNIGNSASPAAGSCISSVAPISRKPQLARADADSVHASGPTVHCVAGYPMASAQEFNGYPVASAHEVNGYPLASLHEVNGQERYPVSSAHKVNGYPRASAHEMNGYPVASAHEVNGQSGYPVASAHEVNGYHVSAHEVLQRPHPRHQTRFKQTSNSYHSASFIKKEQSRFLHNRQSSFHLERGPLVDSETWPQESHRLSQYRLLKKNIEKPEEMTDYNTRFVSREPKTDCTTRRDWRAKSKVFEGGDLHLLPSERFTQKQSKKPDPEARVMTRRRYYGRFQQPEYFTAAHAQTVESGSEKKQYKSVEPNRDAFNDKEHLDVLNKTVKTPDSKLVSSTIVELTDHTEKLVKIDHQLPLNNDSSDNAQVIQTAEKGNCINEVQNVSDNTLFSKTSQDEQKYFQVKEGCLSRTYQQTQDNLNANNSTFSLAVKQDTTSDPAVHQTLSNQENGDPTLGPSAPSNHIHELDIDHSSLADPFDIMRVPCEKNEQAIDTKTTKCFNLKPNSETWNLQNSLTTVNSTDKAALSRILRDKDSFRKRSKSVSSALDTTIADPHIAAIKKASRKGSVGSLPQWPPSPVIPPSQTPQRFHSPSFDFIHVPPWPPMSNQLPHVKLPAKASPKRSWSGAALSQWPPSPNTRFRGQALDAKAKRRSASGSRSKLPPWPPGSERMALHHQNPVKTFNASSRAARKTALSPDFMSDPVPKRPRLLDQNEFKGVCRDSSGERPGYSSLPSSPDFLLVQEIQRRLSAKETSQHHPFVEGATPTPGSHQNPVGQSTKVILQGMSPFSDQLVVKQALTFEQDRDGIQLTSSRPSSPDQINHVQSPKDLKDEPVYQLTSSMPSSPDPDVLQEATKLRVNGGEKCSQESSLEAISKKEVDKEEDQDSGLPALSSGPNLHSDQSRNMDSSYSSGIPRNLPSDISSISNCSTSSSHPRNFHSDHSNVLDNSTSTHHPLAASNKHHHNWNRTCCLDQSCLAEEQNNRELDQTCILDQRHMFDQSLLSEQNSSVKPPSATRQLGGVRTGQGRLMDQSPILNSSASSCLPRSQHSDRSNLTDLSMSFPSVEQSHSTEFSMCTGQLRLQYSREQLLAISPAVIDPSVLLHLQELDLLGTDKRKKKRKRGCRGGRRLKLRKAAYMAKLGLLPSAESSEGQLTTSPDNSSMSSSLTNSSSSAPPSSAYSSFSDDLTCREDVLKTRKGEEDANSTRGPPFSDASACLPPGVDDHANAQSQKTASYRKLSEAGCFPLAHCSQPFSTVRGNTISSIINSGSKRRRWQDFETSNDDSKPTNLTPVPEESSSFFSPAAAASASKNKTAGSTIPDTLKDSGKISTPPLISCLFASSDHIQQRSTDENPKRECFAGSTDKTTSEDLISFSEPSNFLKPPSIVVATDLNLPPVETANIRSIGTSQPREFASLGSESLDNYEALGPETTTSFFTQDSTMFLDHHEKIGSTCKSGRMFSRVSDLFSNSYLMNPAECAGSSVEELHNLPKKKTAYFLPFEHKVSSGSVFRFTASGVEMPLHLASLHPQDLNGFPKCSDSKGSLFTGSCDKYLFQGLLSPDSSEPRANEEIMTSSGTDLSQLDNTGEWVWSGPVPAASCRHGVQNPETQLALTLCVTAAPRADPFALDFMGTRLQPDHAERVTDTKSSETNDETKKYDMQLCASFPVDDLPTKHFFDKILTSSSVLTPAVLDNYAFKPNAQDRYLLSFELTSEEDPKRPISSASRQAAAEPLRGLSSNLADLRGNALVFFQTQYVQNRRRQTELMHAKSSLLPLMSHSSCAAGACVSFLRPTFNTGERPGAEVLAVLKQPVNGLGAAPVKSILVSSSQPYNPVSIERKWINRASSILNNLLSVKLPLVLQEKSEVAVGANRKRDYYEPSRKRNRRKTWMRLLLGLVLLCSAVVLILLLVFSQR